MTRSDARLYAAIAALWVFTFAVCLGACSPSESHNGDRTPPTSTAEAPKCSDVWVVGKALPDDYDKTGCIDDNGLLSIPAIATWTCDDGSTLNVYGLPSALEDKGLGAVKDGVVQSAKAKKHC